MNLKKELLRGLWVNPQPKPLSMTRHGEATVFGKRSATIRPAASFCPGFQV